MRAAMQAVRLSPLLHLALLALLLAQFGYWRQTHEIRPALAVIEPAPSREAAAAISFGDEQFFFRVLALSLQNSGDTFGRFTALRDYDYRYLYQWFTLLDALDAVSDTVPALAAYYYSQTQNVPDARYVVDYLYEHSIRDVGKNWWWLVQALYIAMHKLEDMELALKIAAPLVRDGVPVWAQQMAALVHEKRGEMEDALGIMETIARNAQDIPPQDLRYMRYFVEERLQALDAGKRRRVLDELKE